MKVQIQTNSKNFYRHYLQILNGISNLSEQELNLLVLMLEETCYGEEDILSDVVKAQSGLTDKQWVIYTNKLKDKGIIVDNKLAKQLYVSKGNVSIEFELELV